MLTWLANLLFQRVALPTAMGRRPDFIVGTNADPYLQRWYLTPWRNAYADVPDEERTAWQHFVRRLPNVYLHCFMRSDDDRALHDHPYHWGSFLLAGRYGEITHEALRPWTFRAHGADTIAVDVEAERLVVQRNYSAGALRFHRATFAHRLVLTPGVPAWTLFFCGPRIREWGFLCPRGWVPWQRFTDPATGGATVGQGCEP